MLHVMSKRVPNAIISQERRSLGGTSELAPVAGEFLSPYFHTSTSWLSSSALSTRSDSTAAAIAGNRFVTSNAFGIKRRNRLAVARSPAVN